jgi:UDP-3-O-[3-hydroxymyristoyl] glucosamine N-acyltransferase
MAGHLRIGQGAEIGAQAGVTSDTAPGAKVLGSPAQPIKDSSRRSQREKDETDKDALLCSILCSTD